MKRLIVSPQAGMCNRFRAICSALLLGELSGRKVYHNWTREPAHPNDIQIIRNMRAASFDDFFEPTDAIPYIAVETHSTIDAVFSEWGQNDGWFPFQSSAIKRLGITEGIRVERTNADSIIESTEKNILLETSLALKPSTMSTEIFERRLQAIYSEFFRPLRKYREISDNFYKGGAYVGVHIRRTDHLKYIDEADIDPHTWRTLFRKKISRDEPVFLCSDDTHFKSRISKSVPHKCLHYDNRDQKTDTSLAFVEFLILSGATRIYGTAKSSFSTQAALFGGKTIEIIRKVKGNPYSPLRPFRRLATVIRKRRETGNGC